MKRFISNRVKHKKIGQQIAEEIMDAQRRADEFSSSSSQSSNSPPSSLDTANSSSAGSLSGSMSGSVSSSSINEKIINNHRNNYELKNSNAHSLPSLTSDSGIDNNSSFDNMSLPSIQSLSNSSLTDISQLEPIPINNLRFVEPTISASEANLHLNHHSMAVNARHHNNVIFNGNPNQQNEANEESDEAAMSLIVCLLALSTDD